MADWGATVAAKNNERTALSPARRRALFTGTMYPPIPEDPAERRAEIAEILARGVLRVLRAAAAQAPNSPQSSHTARAAPGANEAPLVDQQTGDSRKGHL